MARYNRWRNASLYEAADKLSEDARRADRGAFFKSIHATFNYNLWADAMWLSRLAGELIWRPASAVGVAASRLSKPTLKSEPKRAAFIRPFTPKGMRVDRRALNP